MTGVLFIQFLLQMKRDQKIRKPETENERKTPRLTPTVGTIGNRLTFAKTQIKGKKIVKIHQPYTKTNLVCPEENADIISEPAFNATKATLCRQYVFYKNRSIMQAHKLECITLIKANTYRQVIKVQMRKERVQ